MKCFRIFRWRKVVLVFMLVCLQLFPGSVMAKSPVKLQKWAGTIDYAPDQPSPFTLAGKASHLGNFTAYGEISFLPPADDGSQLGEGVVVFEAANGDLIVGLVAVDTGLEGVGPMHFSWRDSVKFSDGTIVESSGRFADPENRPPGLVVIAIIAILIGLLLPAVQK